MQTTKDYNERLKKIRHLFGLAQSKFAKIMEIEKNTIKDIETRKCKISPELAIKIERKLNVSANWLLNGEGEIFLDSPKKENKKC